VDDESPAPTSYAVDRVGQVSPASRPGKPRTLWWGATRRCPRCGSGNLFRGWFTIADSCPRCGLRFEREEGYWVGAMAINIGATLFVFFAVFAVALALTIPDVPIWLLAIVVPITVVVPVLFYPFSKTIWMAVDRAVLQRLDPNERLDELHRGRNTA